MKNPIFATLAFALCMPAGPAAAQEMPVEVAPSGPWVLDFGDQYCALRRDFGDDEAGMLLEMRQYLPSNGFDLLLGSDDFETTDETPQITFLPGDSVELPSARFLRAPGGIEGFAASTSLRPGDEERAVVVQAAGEEVADRDGDADAEAALPEFAIRQEWSDADRSARESAITGIRIDAAFERSVIVQTGALNGAMDALRVCMDDLMRSRGVDPDAPRSELSRIPIPVNQDRWVRRLIEAYPMAALSSGLGARIRLFLQIGNDGRVSHCDVRTNLDAGVFVDTACRQLSRYARFDPALDADGNPTVGFWTTSVIYQIS